MENARAPSVATMAQAGPFFGGSGDGTFSQDLFFSFTTLTTTGYGSLVPVGNPGQTFAVLEMLIGQLFLVTAVAKAVSAWQPGQRGPGLRSDLETDRTPLRVALDSSKRALLPASSRMVGARAARQSGAHAL